VGYRNVNHRFVKRFVPLLEESVSEHGSIEIPLAAAEAVLAAQKERADRLWAGSPILWAHDEAQALLSVQGIGGDAFDGAWSWVVAAKGLSGPTGGDDEGGEEPESEHAAPCSRGLLYGLLVAVRVVMERVPVSWHLLTGTNWDLNGEVLSRHSPAQGCAQAVEVTTALSTKDMREWLSGLLTPAAMAGATDERLHLLRGRPLFLSFLWVTLAEATRRAGVEATAATLVAGALDDMWSAAVTEAEARIERLYDRYAPSSRGITPATLMRYLFHRSLMDFGSVSVEDGRWRGAVREAVTAGILNVGASAGRIPLDAEATTLKAIRTVGLRRVRARTDGVMELLAERMTGPGGGSVESYGPVQEDCVAWYLLRRFLSRSRSPLAVSPPESLPESEPQRMEELMEALHVASESTMPPGCEHYCLTPPDVANLEFHLREGRRCDGAEWEARCPLRLLEANPDLLLHHFRPSMAGPDIIFLARGADGHSRLVCMSLKNRTSGSLPDSIRSVTVGTWYGRDRSRHPAHEDLLGVLSRNPEWFDAIRVLVGARPVADAVLHDIALLNHRELARHPVFFFQPQAYSLGVDIRPRRADAEYSRSGDWPRDIWPVDVPGLHRVEVLPPIPSSRPIASLVVRLSGRASKAEIRSAVGCRGTDLLEGVHSVTEHRTPAVGSNAISLHFRTFGHALRLWQTAAEGRVVAEHQPVFGRAAIRAPLAATFA
jgi:hypothetical protein